MRRTRAEMRADDRESVRSNIDDLGAHGALRYATKRLAELPPLQVRRILLLTIREAAKRLDADLSHAKRMAAIHGRHLRAAGIPLAYLLVLGLHMAALAAPAAAQQAVWTNVVNGRPQAEIVRRVGPVRPAAPVPASITTTPVLPRGWRPPLGPTDYARPVPVPPATPPAHRHGTRPEPAAPWYVNGIYVGRSPNGTWMATAIGRPVVDVNIVGTPPRRPR